MPTKEQAVDVTVTTTTISTPVRNYGNLGLVAGDGTGTILEAQTFYTYSDVNDEYGNSNMTSGSLAMFNNGAEQVTCVMASSSSASDIEQALEKLEDEDVQIVSMARLTSSSLLTKLETHVEGQDRIGVSMGTNAETTSSLTSKATTLGSKNMMLVGHKSDDMVGCSVAAVVAKRKPWVGSMWKSVSDVTTDYYTDTEVTTLETGNVNAIIDVGGNDVLSCDKTTQGSGNYVYIWVTRTENWIKQECEDALTNLKLGTEHLAFDESGFKTIEATLKRTMEGLKDDGAVASYEVSVPDVDRVSSADKTNGLVSDIEVSGILSGNVYEFGVSLELSL